MIVVQEAEFAKAVKKLHKNQKKDLDAAVMDLMKDPYLGEMKKGDLAGVRVYKFRMVGQLTLLAYEYVEERIMLKLLSIGTHENFYRNLKH